MYASASMCVCAHSQGSHFILLFVISAALLTVCLFPSLIAAVYYSLFVLTSFVGCAASLWFPPNSNYNLHATYFPVSPFFFLFVISLHVHFRYNCIASQISHWNVIFFPCSIWAKRKYLHVYQCIIHLASWLGQCWHGEKKRRTKVMYEMKWNFQRACRYATVLIEHFFFCVALQWYISRWCDWLGTCADSYHVQLN